MCALMMSGFCIFEAICSFVLSNMHMKETQSCFSACIKVLTAPKRQGFLEATRITAGALIANSKHTCNNAYAHVRETRPQALSFLEGLFYIGSYIILHHGPCIAMTPWLTPHFN